MRKIIKKLIHNHIKEILIIYKKTLIKETGFASDNVVEICYEVNKLTNLIDKYREE